MINLASLSEENYNSEELILKTLNNFAIGYVKVSNNSVILNHNLTYNKIFGFDPEKNLIGTKTYNYWLNSEERDKFREILYENGIIKKLVVPAKKLDGEKIFLEINIQLNKNSNGEVISSEGTYTVVTERIKTKQKLKESEEKFRTAVENSPNFIVFIKRDGTILEVNHLVKGFTKEMVIGQNVFSKHFYETKDQRESARKAINDSLESGETIRYEHSQIAPDGSFATYENKVSPLRYDDEDRIISFQLTIRDITEIKEKEKNLKESDERIRRIVENAPFGYYRVGKDGLWQYVNPAWEKMHDYSLQEIIGKSFEITQPENAKEQARLYVQRVLSGESITGEFGRSKKDGTLEYHTFNIQPIYQKGEIIAIEGFINDITELKETEQRLIISENNLRKLNNELERIIEGRTKELKESENKLRKFMESATDGFILFDSKLNYIDVNDVTLQTVEMTREELIGKNILDIAPNLKETGRYDKYLDVLKTGEPFSTEDVTFNKLDRSLSSAFSTRAFKVGDNLGIIFTDITERKETEKKNKKIKDRLVRLTDNADEAIFRVNAKGGYVAYANPAAERLFGYSKAEWISDPHLGAKIILPDFVERQKEIIEDLNTNKKPIKNAILCWRAKDGREVIMEYTIIPIIENNGQIVYFESIGRDITERKKAEQKLKESEHQYRGIIDSINDPIHLVGKDLQIFLVNPAFKEWVKTFDIDPDILGKKVFEAFPFLPDLVLDEYQQVFSTGKTLKTSGKVVVNKKEVFTETTKIPIFRKGGVNQIITIVRDITVQKQAQSKIEYQAKLVENVSDAIISTNLDFDIISWNNAAESIYGWKAEEVIGKNLMDTIIVEHLYDDQETLVNDIYTKGFWSGEFIQTHKNGNKINVLSSVSIINELTGNPIGAVVINHDITERKKREDELRLQSKIIANMSEGVYLIRVDDGTIVYTNPAFEEMFGYNPSEMIGRDVSIVNAPTDKNPEEIKEEIIRILVETGDWNGEIENIKKDGTHFWCYANVSLFDHPEHGKVILAIHTDITTRKKTDEALKASAIMLQKSQEIGQIGSFEMDLATNEVVWSDQLYELFGLKKEGRTIDYEKVLAMIHPDDRERAIKTSNKAVKVLKPYTLEHRVIHPDGKILDLLIIGDVIRNEKNEVVKIGGTTQDISERKKRDDELLLQSEIMINMSEGVNLVRVDKWKFIYANPAFEEMFGYNPGEIIGRDVSILNAPADKNPEELKEEIIGILVETGEWHGEIKNIKKDGTYIWSYANISFFDHPVYGKVFVSIHTDITDRKKKEEKIRLQSEIMTNMSEGVYLTRLEDLIIVYVNPRFEQMFGYESGEMIGKYVVIVNAPTEKTPEETKNEIVGILQETGEWHGELQNIKKDGTLFWCYANVSLFDHPEYGKVIVSVHTDITERKKREDEIFDLAQFPSESPYPILRVNRNQVMYINEAGKRLLNQVDFNQIPNIFQEGVKNTFENNELTESEVELNGRVYSFIINPVVAHNYVNIYGMDITERKNVEDKLKEINRLKSEFLRRASHELKTPLISIKGFSDLILSLYEDELDPVIASNLKEINDGCERLQNIINDLLQTSRLESSDLKPNLQKEDLSFLINFCVHELQSLAERRKQSITLEVQNMLFANFEKEEIHDVLSNLLANAIKYTPPMGKIEIKTELKKDFVVVSIRDNGIGFTEEEKTRIFQQFGKIERYGQGLDLGIDGTGLGLYISKRIVESHGGKIWMESKGKNKGASFYFTLPVAN